MKGNWERACRNGQQQQQQQEEEEEEEEEEVIVLCFLILKISFQFTSNTVKPQYAQLTFNLAEPLKHGEFASS